MKFWPFTGAERVMPRLHCRIEDIDVIAPNFKRRLSGVTSTIIQLVPLQAKTGLRIATLGPGLPDHLPFVRFRDLWRLWRKPEGKSHRIWHARRNVEMVAGLVLRDTLRMPLKLVFTSAAQRHHKAFTRFLISRMDRIIATSTKSAGFLTVPFSVIMHGIDLEYFTPSMATKNIIRASLGLAKTQKLIGCFGRVRHQKGTDLFVDAMIALLPEHPDWLALVCGRVTAEHAQFGAKLKARVEDAGLSKRILFLGEVPDILPYYQALDLYVAPSRNEGFGLTPLEAMACGVPVVASDAGAYGELVVDGVTGYVVSEVTAAALAEGIERLVNKSDLLRASSRAARHHVEQNFGLQIEATKIGKVYDALLERYHS